MARQLDGAHLRLQSLQSYLGEILGRPKVQLRQPVLLRDNLLERVVELVGRSIAQLKLHRLKAALRA